ncbi:hypothetical protein [Rhizobium leguminosarum]|uniref:hypothetical protein n=1 Tax=Rhizobium leguminosarum TaxID=384 RepID=UPI003F97C293
MLLQEGFARTWSPRHGNDWCDDAAGRRYGARSAASRPGGYDGYSSWARPAPRYGGSVYVRGHYRKNGTNVRNYTRRR